MTDNTQVLHGASTMQAMRDATHDVHRDLERILLIACPDASKADYLAYVAALWGWLAPFEQSLWETGWPATLLPEQRSVKRFWLEADLRAAGFTEAMLIEIAQCPPPPLASAAERLGWAYVIEGAQLGGQVLRKSLAPALSPWEPRWLSGYAAQTSAFWKAFVAYADTFDDPLFQQEAGHAARAAFASLAAWLAQQHACLTRVQSKACDAL